jgi:hypothetical protein
VSIFYTNNHGMADYGEHWVRVLDNVRKLINDRLEKLRTIRDN